MYLLGKSRYQESRNIGDNKRIPVHESLSPKHFSSFETVPQKRCGVKLKLG